MRQYPMNYLTGSKVLGLVLAGFVICTPAMARQSRVATPSGSNAKAPTTKAPKAPAKTSAATPPATKSSNASTPAPKAPAATTSTSKATAVTTSKTSSTPKTSAPPATTTKPATTSAPGTKPATPAAPTSTKPASSKTPATATAPAIPAPAKPTEAKTVTGVTLGGKPVTTTVATIARPASTPTEVATKPAPVEPAPPTDISKSDADLAKALVDLADGKITSDELARQLAGNAPSGESAESAQLTQAIINAATQALSAVPSPRLPSFNGSLRYVGTDWSALFGRAGGSVATQAMLADFTSLTSAAAFNDPARYTRPATMAEIAPAQLDQRAVALPIDRNQLFSLAMVDCTQTAFLLREGVMLAVSAKYTRNPQQIALAISMLEAANKYVPLQRPGATVSDLNVPINPGGDGVWLATAWGISAIVDMLTILGDDVPVDLRNRLAFQLRGEVKRIVEDWRDQRPWFVRVHNVISNQWIEPTIGLIKACLYLGDPRLLPAYNLGAENLAQSLRAHGTDGAFLEGVTYAEGTMFAVHDILASMRRSGDSRCADFPFPKNNWKWFVQMYMPGSMLVNNNDSGRSELPSYNSTVPLRSLIAAVIASNDPDALAMIRYLYPSPTSIGALEAIQYSDFLAANGGSGRVTVPPFAYFPSQQMVTWRSSFEPISSAQTALGLWMKGGTQFENHTHREQGHLSIYNGEQVVLMDCGTPFYGDPTYMAAASSAGSNIMQLDELMPHGNPVNAPLVVNSLDANGGSVSINSSAAYLGASCTREINWNATGRVSIKDDVSLAASAPVGAEFYRFHTGSSAPLQISGSGRDWTVTWPGVTMTIQTSQDVTVEQSSFPDKVQAPYMHQVVFIKAARANTRTLSVMTDLTITRPVSAASGSTRK